MSTPGSSDELGYPYPEVYALAVAKVAQQIPGVPDSYQEEAVNKTMDELAESIRRTGWTWRMAVSVIARRRAIGELKRYQRHQKRNEDAAREPDDREASPEPLVYSRAAMLRLRWRQFFRDPGGQDGESPSERSQREAKSECARLFELHVVDEREWEELAEKEEVPAATLRKRYSRCVERFRKMLREQGYRSEDFGDA